MNNKSIFLVVFVILSASLVFAMGKVDAVDSQSVEAQTRGEEPLKPNKYAYYHDLQDKLDKAKNRIERNAINLLIVTGPGPEKDTDHGLIQGKYDAVFDLMSGKHTKEDAQAVVNQVYKEKIRETKQSMLDALSNSPYKDIIASAYENIAETDEDIFIKGFATHLFIKTGNEIEGFELVKKLFVYMNEQNELAYYYNGLNAFTGSEIKMLIKEYLLNLRDDQSKGDVIRSYAALICHQKYKSQLEPYYEMIEKTILDTNIKKNTAEYILDKLKQLSRENQEAKNVLNAAAKSGNATVKAIIDEWEK